MSDAWAIVATYSSLIEAELALGRLKSAGILAHVDQHDAVGLFGPGHAGTSIRGVDLVVPDSCIAEARMALDMIG
ncbi:MAG: hypothetical protein V3U67_03740 [Gemmatimonadota bacterium]